MDEQDCIIGVDAGSSFIKAVAFNLSGEEVAKYEIPHQLSQPHPLWFEQDMAEMWAMTCRCITHVSEDIHEKQRKIIGLGLTSTGDGTFLMDGDGKPVRAGMMWCDGRSGKIIERWHSEGVAQEAFKICGTSVFTGSQAAQLNWLRENEPETLARAAVIFHAKDFLFYKLTGVISSDETDESLTMLRMDSRQYDESIFRIFKIDDLFHKFPTVRTSQENVAPILTGMAEELSLPKDLLIGSGPMDVAACAFGSGAIEHGEASSILGTAGIHQVVMNVPILEPEMVGMTLCHGMPGRWIRMMAAMTATPNLDWFLREFGKSILGNDNGEIFKRLESEIQKIPPGCDGVIYHPYLFPGGERGPFVKPSARGSFTGLSLNHTSRHLLRAVYEGVALATVDCYQHMPVEVRVVYLSGGGANSEIWCQIISDCLGKSIKVPAGSEFGAKGAALNVGIALGTYLNAKDAVGKTIRIAHSFEPASRNIELYQTLYSIYRMTYQKQMDVWDLRANILDR